MSDAMIQMAPGSEEGYDERYNDWLDEQNTEPTGSCEHCGTNLYGDETLDGHLCDQCFWSLAMGASRSNEEIPY